MKILALALLVLSSTSWGNSFTVDFRNDLWTRPQTDRYLTNVIGVKIKHDDLYDFVKFFLPDYDADHFITRVQQDMYTPEDIETENPDPMDRPYAGHLYLEITKVNFSGDLHHYTTIQVGVIGPMSLAAEAQGLVHDWTGSTEANGWETQLENELGLKVGRLVGLKTDLYEQDEIRVTNITYGELSLGNVKTSAAVGTKFTAGYNPPRQNTVDGLANFSMENPWSVYIQAQAKTEAVGWDFSIDGNTPWFGERTQLERNDIVHRFDYGLVVRYKKLSVKFTQTLITEQHKTQTGKHQFGGLLFQYHTDTESVANWFEDMMK